MRSGLLALLLPLAMLGCAREARPLTAEDHYYDYFAPPVFPEPATLAAQSAGPHSTPMAASPASEPPAADPPRLDAPAPLGPAPRAPAPPPFVGRPDYSGPPLLGDLFSSATIPAGDGCLKQLDDNGIQYRRGPDKQGLDTPVIVSGQLGGVSYYGSELLLDCRLAVALERAGPTLRALGVTRARFSGAYSYRMTRTGRLSLHAHGLAIDVHELVTDAGQHLKVSQDFRRGLGQSCGEDAPTLNRVACQLKRLGLFRELLTPDFNADHHDHFHFGITPLNRPDPVQFVKPKLRKSAPDNRPAGATATSRSSHTRRAGKGSAKPKSTTLARNSVEREAKRAHDGAPNPKADDSKPTATKPKKARKSKSKQRDKEVGQKPADTKPRGAAAKDNAKADKPPKHDEPPTAKASTKDKQAAENPERGKVSKPKKSNRKRKSKNKN